MRSAGALLLVVCGGAAQAEPYPETYVDRPQLLYQWMTSADVSLDLSHYTDSAGTKHVDSELDLFSAFSLGEAEFGIRIVGSTETLSASLQLGRYGVVTGAFEYYVPQTTFRYAFAETLTYAYKALVVPHQLALYFYGNARLLEESLTPAMMLASAGSVLFVNFGTEAQFQLTRRLSIQNGFSFGVPVAQSDGLLISPSSDAGTYVQMVQTLHRLDFYANASFGDLAGIRNVAGSTGLVYRWGGS